MGVIKRQSIKQSIVNYLAVGVAAISTIFIYPLDKEAYGLAQFVISTALLCMPFIMLGISGATIRFFPKFQEDQKGGQGFLFFMLLGVGVGALVFILLWLLFREKILAIYAECPEIYRRFFPHIITIAILMAFLQLFITYSSNFKRIVIPAMLQNLIKLSLPILILLFVFDQIDENGIINGIALTYIIALLLGILYVAYLKELKWKPDFSWFTKKRRKEIGTFALFSLGSGIGSVLAFRIDSIMISSLIDFESNGVYNIAAFIANVIAIPTAAIMQITAPIVSESFKEKDLNHVSFLYKQSSLNLMLAGLFLFVCIVASVEDLFSIMPKSEEMIGGFMIVLLIGAARVIDMATSINNHIINYSQYFRFSLVAILLLAVVNVFANYMLIPRFGIIGAAMASLGALAVFNLAKLLFIYWKFKIQPFSKKTIYLSVLAGVCFLIAFNLPATEVALVDILIKSLVIAVIYLPAIYYLKISDEVNKLIDSVLGLVRRN